jgi:voltage-gated potassium channel
MNFIRQACAGVVLVALTISLQSAGMAAFINWVRSGFAHRIGRFGAVHSTRLIVRFTTVLFALHLLQILLWAGFYRWFCFPSWGESFYFSITSFSTVGYGDLILPRMWRVLGPVESVTGVLMCGLSVSLLFAIVNRLVGHSSHPNPQSNQSE